MPALYSECSSLPISAGTPPETRPSPEDSLEHQYWTLEGPTGCVSMWQLYQHTAGGYIECRGGW